VDNTLLTTTVLPRIWATLEQSFGARNVRALAIFARLREQLDSPIIASLQRFAQDSTTIRICSPCRILRYPFAARFPARLEAVRT